MYKELNKFLRHILSQKSIWKDGELWTALFFAMGSFLLFYYHQEIIAKIRGHFTDILTFISIIFGFVFTALVFYIQAAESWDDNEKIKRLSRKIIDWHIWTIINLIFLIGYIFFLLSLGHLLVDKVFWNSFLYAVLIFFCFYIIFQVLNHILNVWWVFKERDRLKGKKAEKI